MGRQRRRAVAALVPPWPQVRTFDRVEMDQHERWAHAWERLQPGPASSPVRDWMDDVQRRAAEAGIRLCPPVIYHDQYRGEWTVEIRPLG